VGQAQVARVERVPAVGGDLRPHVGVAVAHGRPVDLQRRHRHRTVHIDRYRGQLAGAHQLTQRHQQHRRPVDRERGRQHHAAAVEGAAQRGGDQVELAGWMKAFPVRRLDHDRVGPRRALRGTQQRVVGAPEVAAERDGAGLGAQLDGSGAEDVAGPAQHDLVARHRVRLARLDRPQQTDGPLGVFPVEEGERGLVSAVAVAGGVLGVLLLQVRRVPQHDRCHLGGAGGAVHRPREPFLHQPRQPATVVEVGVAEHDRVHITRGYREPGPIAPAQFPLTLVQAAVHQDPAARGLHQEPAAGHRTGGAEKPE
jgi:hypothetical protein